MTHCSPSKIRSRSGRFLLSLMGSLGLLSLGGCASDATHPPDDGTTAALTTTGEPRATALPAPRADATQLERMQRYLDTRLDPATVRHRFRMASGEVVECVDVYRQPALLRPEMKGQNLQTSPQHEPEPSTPNVAAAAVSPRGAHAAIQEYRAQSTETDDEGNLRNCPAQTVPFLRATIDQLRNFTTLEDFFNKLQVERSVYAGSGQLHQHAHAAQYWTANWGAETVINLWNPSTARSDEFSLSQMWIAAGAGPTLQTLEAGWQNWRNRYGDERSHLFIYSTRDGYEKTGCYNLDCNDFVQVDSTVLIGGAFSQYSVDGGPQYELKLAWMKSTDTDEWWLRYGDTWVGYYPRSLFGTMQHSAEMIDFGGEIVDRRTGGRHTATQMGSGAEPSEGFGHAAYQRNIQYLNLAYNYEDPDLHIFASDPYCYDAALLVLDNDPSGWGRSFFFGGNGNGATCN